MSGAVTELVALGVQDTYLTGDPQMSFFRQVYKRHTNFALESVRQIFKGQHTASGMTSITLKRAGDLVNGIYLCADKDDGSAASNGLASFVDRVELYIGGQKIDEYSGAASAIFANGGVVPQPSTGQIPTFIGGTVPEKFLPLYFFCCNDSNSPLPLVALQYHDVDVRIYWTSTAVIAADNITLYANYTYLDTQERNVFAQNKQELLITQHQELTWTEGETIIDLPFSHPVKALFLASRDLPESQTLDFSGVAQGGRLTLELNGQQRFEPQNSTFFEYIQPYYHSKNGYWNPNTAGNAGIHVYSFALDYSTTQPSGTLNFSRIDNARWHVTSGTLMATGTGDVLRCNAINYNILKCENGMGGLLFAN